MHDLSRFYNTPRCAGTYDAAPREREPNMSETKTYTGGCHCGKVRYEVTAAIDKAYACNCSICSKTGGLLAFAPADQLKLLSGEDALTDYQFNKKNIHHLFCSTCGIRSFAHGAGPDGKKMCMISLRCLDDFDYDALPVTHFDGKSL
jgi:hypothetical protein